MRYKLLGKSGLRVSEICLGTMTFGEEFGWGASYEESRKIFDAFINAGGNFIDTANEIYTGGTSETYLGDFIASERERMVLATKYTDSLPTTDPNQAGNQRKSMIQSVERSLKRLKTDYIDLFWLHSWDFMTPVEEVMRAFDDLVRAGKVLYIGVSDTPAWVVSRANMLAELRGWTSFIAMQVEYNLIERTAERELIPMAKALDIGVLGWSVLASGILTGKYNKTSDTKESRRLDKAQFYELSERNLSIASSVTKIAEEIEYKSSQVAINWVRSKGVIPILGATKLSQIQDNLTCLDFQLSSEHIQELDEISQIEMGFPHDFLERTKGATFGNTFDLIDNQHT
jgi:aryl-alcohol dehydrogenase-like predicted oxidoreductase